MHAAYLFSLVRYCVFGHLRKPFIATSRLPCHCHFGWIQLANWSLLTFHPCGSNWVIPNRRLPAFQPGRDGRTTLQLLLCNKGKCGSGRRSFHVKVDIWLYTVLSLYGVLLSVSVTVPAIWCLTLWWTHCPIAVWRYMLEFPQRKSFFWILWC